MITIYVLLIIAAAVFIVYPFLAFIVSPFIIPNLRKIQYQNVSPELQKTVNNSILETDSKEIVVKKIFYLVVNHLGSEKKLQFKSPGKLFSKDVNKVWKAGGVQSCNVQNMILANLLVASGHFGPEDIELKTTNIFINIHKYLKVKIGDEYINLDSWGYHYMVPFGQYVNGSPFKLKKRKN